VGLTRTPLLSFGPKFHDSGPRLLRYIGAFWVRTRWMHACRPRWLRSVLLVLMLTPPNRHGSSLLYAIVVLPRRARAAGRSTGNLFNLLNPQLMSRLSRLNKLPAVRVTERPARLSHRYSPVICPSSLEQFGLKLPRARDAGCARRAASKIGTASVEGLTNRPGPMSQHLRVSHPFRSFGPKFHNNGPAYNSVLGPFSLRASYRSVFGRTVPLACRTAFSVLPRS
jgi:hypothetical protein